MKNQFNNIIFNIQYELKYKFKNIYLKIPLLSCIKVDKKLDELIEVIFAKGRENYGSRRISDKLKELYGSLVSRKRISNIIKDLNLKLKMKRRYKNTTDSNHNLSIASNILNRDFYASNPNEKYVGDITYISTGEGWLYLATIIDLYSRKVVGWSIWITLRKDHQ